MSLTDCRVNLLSTESSTWMCFSRLIHSMQEIDVLGQIIDIKLGVTSRDSSICAWATQINMRI